LRKILVLSFVALNFTVCAQSFLVFKERKIYSHQEQIAFVDSVINIQPSWNKRKVEFYCLKSKLYNRIGEYKKADSIIHSISLSAIKKYSCQGEYQLALAENQKYLGNSKDAYQAFKKAEKHFKKSKEYCKLANAYVEEAEFHRKTAQFEIGEAYIDSASNLISKYRCDSWVKVKMLNRYAAIANEFNGTKRRALAISKECIALAEQEKASYWLAVSYNEIGSIYNKYDQKKLAIEFTKKAEKEFRKMGLLPDAMHAKLGLAHHSIDLEEIIVILEEIVKEVGIKKLNYDLYLVYEKLYTIYKSTKQFEKALYYHEAINQLRDQKSNKNRADELAKIADEFNSVKLQSENESIKLKNELKEELIKRQQNQFITILIFSVCLILLLLALSFSSAKRKRLNNELLIKNKQKDTLIKEVHHRVKNNLQFVKSILLFQSTKENKNDETLKDISRRIDAISLVHEMLYSNNSFNEISVKEYLEKLIQYSEELYQGVSPIQTNLQIENIHLPVQKLESIGIICAELLSNSVKHAFENTSAPLFTVQLKKVEKNTYLLHIFDNGTIKHKNKDGLGIQMIDIYSRQMKGEYFLERENGYHYKLKFVTH
jgi:two-component sensor histidine kinase